MPNLTPKYSTMLQRTIPDDTSDLLDVTVTTCLQEIVGTLLYYKRDVNRNMYISLRILEAFNKTQDKAQAHTKILNYYATHPDATIRFYRSKMCLKIHSDASYLSKTKACICSKGYFTSVLFHQIITNCPPPPQLHHHSHEWKHSYPLTHSEDVSLLCHQS